MGDLFLGNALSRVAHLDQRLLPLGSDADGDGALLLGELDGVVQKVVEHLMDGIGIRN